MSTPTEQRPAHELRIGMAYTYMDQSSPDYEVNLVIGFIAGEGPTGLGLNILRYWPNAEDGRPQGEPDSVWIGPKSTQRILEAARLADVLGLAAPDHDFKAD